jgi:hypothetical protein
MSANAISDATRRIRQTERLLLGRAVGQLLSVYMSSTHRWGREDRRMQAAAWLIQAAGESPSMESLSRAVLDHEKTAVICEAQNSLAVLESDLREGKIAPSSIPGSQLEVCRLAFARQWEWHAEIAAILKRRPGSAP